MESGRRVSAHLDNISGGGEVLKTVGLTKSHHGLGGALRLLGLQMHKLAQREEGGNRRTSWASPGSFRGEGEILNTLCLARSHLGPGEKESRDQ